MSAIKSILHETRIFPPSADFLRQATLAGMERYCKRSAPKLKKTCPGSGGDSRENISSGIVIHPGADASNHPFFRWFDDGELNVSFNCLDRHLTAQPDKNSYHLRGGRWHSDRIAYRDLYHRICQLANGLKSRGIGRGDRVIIYMPMSIEAVVAMQACARIGATHSVVFGGFSAKSLHERILNAGAVAVITADEQHRGGKINYLKTAVDKALAMGKPIPCKPWWCINADAATCTFDSSRDVWWPTTW